jgi:hypothetical protein
VNRGDVIAALKASGYDGPVSYTKGRLEELLAGRGSSSAPVAQPPPPAGGPEPGTDTPAPKVGGRRGGKKAITPRPSRFVREDSWEYSPGHVLDTEHDFQVDGEGGWFHFIAKVTNPRHGHWWIDAYGGTSGHGQFRAFRPERLRRLPSGTIKIRKHKKVKKTEETEDA